MEIEKRESDRSELLRFALIALAIVILVRVFIAEPYVVSGSSMVPTFENTNYLIVDKISYRLGAPKRDDVVIFIYPDPNPKNERKFFIKRIIGLPNETLDIKNGIVTITNRETPAGFVLTEPYIHGQLTSEDHLELKSNEYYVMGDNRNASSDSRVWDAVPRKNLIGRAFLRLRLWPINDLVDILPGNYQQKDK